MTSFLSRTASLVRSALMQDAATQRALENTYVEVRRNSRLWGI
jgi:hypothetical protein